MNRSSPRLRIIISSDMDISETSNSAKLSCRQNISAGPSTVLAKSTPSALTRPSMIGQMRGLLVMARLSRRLAMLPPRLPALVTGANAFGACCRRLHCRDDVASSLSPAASYNKFLPSAQHQACAGWGGYSMIASLRRITAMAVCLAAAASAPASADTTLIVGKASATSDAIIPVNVGDTLGIFKRHGLDLKIIEFGGGSKMVQGLAAGSIDIGDGAGTEMAFIAKGAPMLAVCQSTGPAPFLGVGVPWDSPIKKLEDLKGKIIGVSSSASFSDWSGHL